MLQDRYPTDKVFADILTLTHEMDPVLSQIDPLLDDDALYQLIRSDLAQRFPHTQQTGRNSTPVEVVLRMLAIKRLYRLSYEQTEYQVRDSLVLRQFCRVYLQDVPDDTTLLRWAALIQPETLEQFNARLIALATQLKLTRGRKLRTDGTVVETHIHPPSDSSLLADGVRVLGRTLRRAKALLGEEAGLAKEVFRNRVRTARRLAHRVGEALRKKGEPAQAAGQKLYRRLVDITQKTLQQVQQVLPVLQVHKSHKADKLIQSLDTFLPRVQQVVAQTTRRVFEGEQVPAGEKLVSIFEAHTDIIRRNKTGKLTEYGHKVWLEEVEGGLVSGWRVLEGNPPDETQWEPSLEHHQEQFGHPPHQASADRGLYSPDNERLAQEKGVQRVILPKPGYRSAERKKHEQQDWFRRGRKWHAGIEGRISGLLRAFELHRCRDHGQSGFEKWVGWGVIAANLKGIGRKLAARA